MKCEKIEMKTKILSTKHTHFLKAVFCNFYNFNGVNNGDERDSKI